MDLALFRQVVENAETDRNVMARFYDKAVKTDKVTDKGLPVFKNVTYIEIRLKDNNIEVFDQPATQEKIRRFPKEYAIYKLSQSKVKNGTPLEQFAFLSAAELATCKNRGIFTVEDLADLSVEKMKDLGLENECQLARHFILNAQHNNAVADFTHKEKEYQSQIEMLKMQNTELLAQIRRFKMAKHAKPHKRTYKGENE